MADSIIGVLQATSPDKKLDTTSLTVGANTVERERVQIAGAGATQLAAVKDASTAAVAADPALVVTLSPNNSVGVAQASTTSGQIGPLMQATTSAFPPAGLTAGKTGPLSLDQGGGTLRVGANSVVDAGNVLGTPWILQPEITEDFAQRSSIGNVLDYEAMNHTAQNTAKHKVDATTMVPSHTTGFSTNSTSITTINTGVGFSTYQYFSIPEGSVNYAFMKIKFTGTAAATNTTVDWGFFMRGASPTYAPTDGVFFRNTSAGMVGVTNYNGTETSTTAFKTISGGSNFVPTAGTEYDTIVYWFNQVAVFWLDMRDGNGYTMMGRVNSTASAGSTTLAHSAPLSVRHAIGGTVASAAESFTLVAYQVTQDGVPLNRPWVETAAAMGLSGAQGWSGMTMGSTANFANASAVPAGATATNTTAALGTGLGGHFSANGASLVQAVDEIIDSYQHPAPTVNLTGRPLVIDSIQITALVTTLLTTNAPLLIMAANWGHTAVSLATTEASSPASAKAPRRKILGVMSVPLAIDSVVVLAQQTFTDIVLQPGEFFAVSAKNIHVAAGSGVVTFYIHVESHGI